MAIVKTFYWIVGLALAFYILTGGPCYYFPAQHIRVMNAVTGKPVPGAIVAVRWYSCRLICVELPCFARTAGAYEAVTDSEGFANVPFKLVPRPQLEVLRRDYQPEIVAAKAGFVEIPV